MPAAAAAAAACAVDLATPLRVECLGDAAAAAVPSALLLLCIIASCSSLMAPAASMCAMNSSGFTLRLVASIISIKVAAEHCGATAAAAAAATAAAAAA
jgi:hypothetical protein